MYAMPRMWPCRLRPGYGKGEAVLEERPVRQAGECVVERLVLQDLLGAYLVGDIMSDSHDDRLIALVALDVARVHFDGAYFALMRATGAEDHRAELLETRHSFGTLPGRNSHPRIPRGASPHTPRG